MSLDETSAFASLRANSSRCLWTFRCCLASAFLAFFAIGRFLLFARKASLEPLELLLSFAVVARGGDGVSFGVGQKAFEPDIYTNLFARFNVLEFVGSS